MERELLITGIGGQGVQLAAQVIARAAISEGMEVQLFGSYGGMMRGGNTDATLVFADGPIEAPPTIASAWSAIVMHPEYAEPVLARIRPGGIVVFNSSVCPGLTAPGATVVGVPGTDLAIETGHIMTASMVMLGAYTALTGLVRLESLTAAVAASLPSYRSTHVALNVAALERGATAAPAVPA
jgi:Pyruvate/2-oxoacid:ferredoxin oxidoreductase gamma subunit